MARSFNGTSDHINMDGAQINGTIMLKWDSPATWACWVNGGGANQCVYCETQPPNTRNQFSINCAGAGGAFINVVLHDNVNNTTLNVTGTHTAFGDSKWHHIAWVQIPNGDASVITCKSYVDGVLDINTSFNADPTFDLDPGSCALGYLHTTDINFYNGKIAHMVSYKVALSANQVGSLANGFPPTHYGPIHYWPLWGASPESDIGEGWPPTPIASPRTLGSLTGTTFSVFTPIESFGLLQFPGRIR